MITLLIESLSFTRIIVFKSSLKTQISMTNYQVITDTSLVTP